MPGKLRSWLLRIGIVAVLAVGGCLLGLRLAGPIDRETALGTVSLRVDASAQGQVDAATASIRGVLLDTRVRAARARTLGAAVDILLAAGDLEHVERHRHRQGRD